MSPRAFVMAVLLAVATFVPPAHASDPFKVRFSWKLKGEYAPLYLAREVGLFDRAGLSVEMGEGAGASAALGAMLQGQEDAVIIPAAFALTAISKGMPIKIVALYHPKAPLGFVSFEQNAVRQPKDIEGKKFAYSVGDTVAAYLPVFCKKNNVDCAKINKIIVNPQLRNSQFMSRQIDVIGAYLNIDLSLLEPVAKDPLVVLDLAKAGLVVPGLSIVVSDAALGTKSGVLARFVKTVGEGFDASRKDSGAAAVALRKSWSGAPDLKAVRRQVEETLAAVPVIEGRRPGWIEAAPLGEALAMLKSVGEIESAKPIDSYFTNALLE
jgi:NitT/TauT family transport system substrate-binding protein